MTTISDVAKKASVGVGTVSRVLSGKGSVAEETKKRVLKAMAELNYRPNSVARSLATSRTNSIGLMIPEFQGRYFGRLISAIEMDLREDAKHLIVANGAGKKDEELAAIDFLQSRECDGLILYSLEISDKELLSLIERFPKVSLLNRVVKSASDNCFMLDHYYGGQLAAKCLLEAGHKKIACITGPSMKEDAIQRQKGFEKALAGEKIKLAASQIMEGQYDYTSGAFCMEELWKCNRDITAVFCGNDEMAVGALFKLYELGVKVPDDVSIIGYDDAHLSSHTFPKLTTISNPIEKIALNAVRHTRNLCYKQENEVEKHFSPELVVRDSVKKHL